jgi:membrane protease YdiL (CAAX protease family)
MSKMKNDAVKRIIQFYLLSYAIAWVSEGIMFICNLFGVLMYGSVGGMLLVALAGAAPAISVYVLFKKWSIIKRFRDYLHFVFANTLSLKTLIMVIAVFGVFFLNSFIFGTSMGNPWYMYIVYIPLMIIGGGLEEIGWRGYAQPALERYMPFPVAAIVQGII